MSDQTTEQQLTIKSHTQKISDNFLVEFLGIPENMGNTLSKQVKSISRPRIGFNVGDQNMRSNTYRNINKPDFERPLQIVLKDDEDGVTSALVQIMIMRQIYRSKSNVVNEEIVSPRFEVKTTIFNSRGTPVEAFSLSEAFISSSKTSDLDYSSENYGTITLSIDYDNIAFSISPNMAEYDDFVNDRGVFDWI